MDFNDPVNEKENSSSLSTTVTSPRYEKWRAESSELLRQALENDSSRDDSFDLLDTKSASAEESSSGPLQAHIDSVKGRCQQHNLPEAEMPSSRVGPEDPLLAPEHQDALHDPNEDASGDPSAADDTRTTMAKQSIVWLHWNSTIQVGYAYVLVLMVFLLWPAGIFALKDLLSKTDSTFHNPIAGSLSRAAQTILEQKFPKAPTGSTNPTLLVVLQLNTKSAANASLIYHPFAVESSLGLESYLNDNVFGSFDSANDTSNNSTGTIVVSSYYGFQFKNLSLLSKPFLSQDERTTFLQVALQLNKDNHQKYTSSKQSMDALMNAMDDYYHIYHVPNDLDIGFTGLDYFSRDLRVSTQQDLHRMDTLILPLALLLVGATLLQQESSQSLLFSMGTRTTGWSAWKEKSKRIIRLLAILLLLPLCGMISTVATWSIIMNSFVVSRVQITQFTPSIMMSLTLGMGIDYTLFLVARFLEARVSGNSRGNNAPTFQAIQIMLEQAGKVVLVSGSTLFCTFLALVALPLPMLQSVGIGAAVAIASAILMNLLVIPALLYTPAFQKWSQRHDFDTNIATSDVTIMDGEGRQENSIQPLTTGESVDVKLAPSTIWIRLAKEVLHPYKSVIIVLIILQFLLWPVAWNSHRLDSSDLSFESVLPQDAPSLETYHRLVDSTTEGGGNFGPGKLAPFRIVLDGTVSNTTMDSSYAFDLQHNLVQSLLSKNNTPNDAGANFVGISVANNVPIPFAVYLASKMCNPTNASRPVSKPELQDCNNDALRCLHVLDEQLLSKDRLATYMIVELQSISPFDKEGIEWLEVTRQRVEQWTTTQRKENQQSKVQVYIDGTAAIAHDAVHAVYSSFPWVIATTLVVVFVLLGIVFRSIIPPLRSVISITFTLAVSFGMTVLVYQDGILDRLHLRSLTSINSDVSWLVPIMSFSIMVGLALDYDVFLVTRILEFRTLEKYDHESSIAAGLDATGGIITSAGIIMALAFGSLLASQSPALHQWAFILTTAILLDTFLVRTILVPAMMGWTGKQFSWYPSVLPTAQTRFENFDVPDQCGDSHCPSREGLHLCDERQLVEILPEDDEVGRTPQIQRRETIFYEAYENDADVRSPLIGAPSS